MKPLTFFLSLIGSLIGLQIFRQKASDDTFDLLKQMPDASLKYCHDEDAWLLTWTHTDETGKRAIPYYRHGLSVDETLEAGYGFFTRMLINEAGRVERNSLPVQTIEASEDTAPFDVTRISNDIFISTIVNKTLLFSSEIGKRVSIRDIAGASHWMGGVFRLYVIGYETQREVFNCEIVGGQHDGVSFIMTLPMLEHMATLAEDIS
ncbi:MAG: hypothetical protein ACPG7F_00460 [Aggregatilineales bacterium]